MTRYSKHFIKARVARRQGGCAGCNGTCKKARSGGSSRRTTRSIRRRSRRTLSSKTIGSSRQGVFGDTREKLWSHLNRFLF